MEHYSCPRGNVSPALLELYSSNITGTEPAEKKPPKYQDTLKQIIEQIKENILIYYCFTYGRRAVRASTVWSNSFHTLKKKPSIFQITENYILTKAEAREMFLLIRPVSSQRFFMPLSETPVILRVQTLPVARRASLFSTGQELEANHLLFSPFSQLNCNFGRSFHKQGTGLFAKQ